MTSQEVLREHRESGSSRQTVAFPPNAANSPPPKPRAVILPPYARMWRDKQSCRGTARAKCSLPWNFPVAPLPDYGISNMVRLHYVELYDLPRAIVLRYKGKLLLLDSPFDNKLDEHDEYADSYSVYAPPGYELPGSVEPSLAKESWRF